MMGLFNTHTHTHTHTHTPPQPQACTLLSVCTEECSTDSTGRQWKGGDCRGAVEGERGSHHGGTQARMIFVQRG